MTQSPILTITLNPALDTTTSVARLEPQRKLRCSPAILHAGGGGANVSRAIRELGGTSRAFVALAGTASCCGAPASSASSTFYPARPAHH